MKRTLECTTSFRYPPFSPFTPALLGVTPRITSFSPSFLAVTQERFSLHSACRIPLAFGGTSSYVFKNPTLSLSLPPISLSLGPRLSPSPIEFSGRFFHPQGVTVSLTRVLLPFLYRSHVTPNYPDVTGAARRFRLIVGIFLKFIGPCL